MAARTFPPLLLLVALVSLFVNPAQLRLLNPDPLLTSVQQRWPLRPFSLSDITRALAPAALRRRIHGGFAPNTRELEADRKNLLGTDEYEDFDDDPIYRFHDADKRQHPDYGHLRFGKRAEFGDYGHLRFGRRSHSSPDTNAGTAAGVTSDGDGQ